MATSIDDLIKSSICFGVAYDPSVKECKICEVKVKCKAKCEGVGSGELPQKPKPEAADIANKSEVTFDENAPKAAKKPTKAAAPKKDEPQYDGLPDLKSMSYDDIVKLAVERGLDVDEFDKKYSNAQIKRMRITMALKKTYEVKK